MNECLAMRITFSLMLVFFINDGYASVYCSMVKIIVILLQTLPPPARGASFYGLSPW